MASWVAQEFGLVWTGSFIGVAFIGTGAGTFLRANNNNIPITIEDPDPSTPANATIRFNNSDGHSESGPGLSGSIEEGAPTRVIRHIKTIFQAVNNDETRNTGSGPFPASSATDARNGSPCSVTAGHFYIFDRNHTMWDITHLVAGGSDGEGRPPIRPGGTGTVSDVLLGTVASVNLFSISGPPLTWRGPQQPTSRPQISAPWLNSTHLNLMITNSSTTDPAMNALLTAVDGAVSAATRNTETATFVNRRMGWLQYYLSEGQNIMTLFNNYQQSDPATRGPRGKAPYRLELLRTRPFLAFTDMVGDHAGSSVEDLRGNTLIHAYNLLTPRIGPLRDPMGTHINGSMVIINRGREWVNI